MSIKTKVLLSIIFAVVLSIAGVTVMVSREMDKAFVANFEVSSEAQLERMNAFVENFFGTAVSSVELLRDSPVLLQNISLAFFRRICYSIKAIRVFPDSFLPVCWNGRRGGLKILWWQHRVGSSPTTGTKPI